MKIFLCYSHKDKKLAGKIKLNLEKYGVTVFLAHDDIEPSEEWAERIIEELRNCHVFIPILTENFTESKWTDQETGGGFFLNKVIIPLKIDIIPYGFISRYQAHDLNIDEIFLSLKAVMEVIASKREVGDLLRDALIKEFGASFSFDNATQNADLLLSIGGYKLEQVRRIIRHTIENNQIHNSFRGRRKVERLVYQYKNRLNSSLYERFQEAVSK